ncbi:hypothetical protein/phosphatidylglycerol lysyltransferase [Arboricoccus pini]|uniref:Lysylphosphatidylglycerol synthase TM region n=1 Tax=Arboricoccus pini TaxID=1963835 RepID=A0A212QPH9_9PROT|nr:lysylphosphatidylglycerol synthase domain-containing protein [Arboricoccus pini]SNB61356.1 hypothetical protein/phosphatidylglycerol lysyltransferase [Arboricoccus pini]
MAIAPHDDVDVEDDDAIDGPTRSTPKSDDQASRPAVGSGGAVMAVMKGHSRLKSLLSIAVGLGLFLISLWVLHRWASNVSLDQLGTELVRISLMQFVLALFFTALSFVALVGYEYYAVRYVHRKLPLKQIAIYSFVTQAVAHAVGFAIFVGATIRYKLYSLHGFNIIDVAKIQVFFTTTFGLGATTLIGIAFVIEPAPLALATTIEVPVWRAIGVVLLAIVLGFILFEFWFDRPVKIMGQVLALPGPKITLLQIFLGIADLASVAAALYVLMPAGFNIDYFELLGIFAAALTVGLISHVPGSLGVFESAVILMIQPSPELTAPLIGALIAFRAIYYMLPLVVGSLTLGVIELRRGLSHARDKRRASLG